MVLYHSEDLELLPRFWQEVRNTGCYIYRHSRRCEQMIYLTDPAVGWMLQRGDPLEVARVIYILSMHQGVLLSDSQMLLEMKRAKDRFFVHPNPACPADLILHISDVRKDVRKNAKNYVSTLYNLMYPLSR